jgi:hypothetical protein
MAIGKGKEKHVPRKVVHKRMRKLSMVYRRAKQHLIPVRPRNQQAPMKRKRAMTALDHRRAWKNRAVREVAVF